MQAKHPCCLLALLLCVCLTSQASAEEPQKRHSVNYRNLTALRLNPLGLVNASALNYQYTLYKSTNPLFQTNYAGLTFQPLLSPAYIRIGAGLELQPLSVLRLSAVYETIKFFGNFNFLQSYASTDANWSDSAQEERADLAYDATGSQLSLGALLQAKVGNVAVRSNMKFMNFDMELNEGDIAWYDPMLDVLIPGNGWGYTNDLDVIYVSDMGLVVGLRDTVTTMWFDGEDPNPISHRVGPLVSYQILTDPGKKVDSVSSFLVVNWYLSHRFRTGEDVNQLVPYVAVGLTVTGQLF